MVHAVLIEPNRLINVAVCNLCEFKVLYIVRFVKLLLYLTFLKFMHLEKLGI